MARLVFFASIREDIGCDQLALELTEVTTLTGLITHLGEIKGQTWVEALSAENVRVAVNQELVTGDPLLANTDEIAFFPPVTGG